MSSLCSLFFDRLVSLFHVAIFVLVCCLLLSSSIVITFSLLEWWITTQPNFHVHKILLFLSDFSFHCPLWPKRGIIMKDSHTQIVNFSLNYLKLANRIGHLIETIQFCYGLSDVNINGCRSCGFFPKHLTALNLIWVLHYLSVIDHTHLLYNIIPYMNSALCRLT